MKKILCTILILALAFTFAACGKANQEEFLSPTLTVDSFLKALKARDTEAVGLYYAGDPNDFNFTEDIDDPFTAELVDKLLNKLLDFDYVLDNEVVDGDTAEVDVHFMTYDVGSIMSDLTSDIMPEILSLGLPMLSGEITSDEVIELIREKLDEALNSAQKVSDFKVTVKLVKKNGKWLVKDLNKSGDMIEKLFGGLKKISGLGSLFG